MRKVDRRVRRTRFLLEQAFFELLAEKTFEAISVKDITERADVNRATFYDHFQDKYNMLDEVIGDLFRRSVQQTIEIPGQKPKDAPRLLTSTSGAETRAQLRLDNLRSDFRQFIAATLEMFNSIQVQRKFQAEPALVIYARVRQEINAALLRDFRVCLQTETRDEADRIASILSWAIFGAAFEWSRAAKSMSADELSSQITGLFARELINFEPKGSLAMPSGA
jgi:AcrR family transcriptional regulator